MKIWIVNHYAVMPDMPGGTRHYELARRFADRGHDVTVLAAGFHYVTLQEQSEYAGKQWNALQVDNLKWVWIKTHPYQVNNHHRLLNMWSFSRNIRKYAASGSEKPEVVIGSTVHPFAALAAAIVARKSKARFWFEIRDLWPQTMIDNGHWKEHSLASGFFRFIEKRTLSHACGVISLSPLTAGYLHRRYGYPENRVALIPNGATRLDLPPSTESEEPSGKVMLHYTGGMDQVHSLDHLITALAYPDIPDFLEIHLTGDGKMREALMKQANDLKIKNLFWNEPVAKSRIREILLSADLLFLCTSRVLYGSENKLAEYLEAGKPVLAYTAAHHNDPVEEIGCGFSALFGDAADLALKINKIAHLTSEQRSEMGNKGRTYFESNLDWDALAVDLMSFIGVEKTASRPVQACLDDAREVALLHKSSIDQGFLSSLPIRFLELLYQYLIIHHIVLVIRNEGSVVGFIAATTGKKPVMRGFLTFKPVQSALVLSRLLFTTNLRKKAVETFKYGRKSDAGSMHQAELLSVAVDPSGRSHGFGGALLSALEKEYHRTGVAEFIVVAGEGLVAANRFYLKNGFSLKNQLEVHQGEVSNVYVKMVPGVSKNIKEEI